MPPLQPSKPGSSGRADHAMFAAVESVEQLDKLKQEYNGFRQKALALTEKTQAGPLAETPRWPPSKST